MTLIWFVCYGTAVVNSTTVDDIKCTQDLIITTSTQVDAAPRVCHFVLNVFGISL